jgi:predicted metalloprotease
VREQQADCFAGVYLFWVADGRSPRFTLIAAFHGGVVGDMDAYYSRYPG